MEIKGRVFCLFEQSGTFKRAFHRLGIDAVDCDIENQFGETDHQLDLFAEIDRAWDGAPSLFDSIGADDLILAFYPCIYFCAMSQIAFSLNNANYKNLTNRQRIEAIVDRSARREEYYTRLVRFCGLCLDRGLRMVFENPWTEQTYLRANFLKAPDIIDLDRSSRGDQRVKPTAYWFFNCAPMHGQTFQKSATVFRHDELKKNGTAGRCSTERSMIAEDYARNFICDFLLGFGGGGNFRPISSTF